MKLIITIFILLALTLNNNAKNDSLYNNSNQIIGIDRENIMSSNQGKVKQANLLNLEGEVHAIGDGYTDYEIKLKGPATHFFAFTENIKRKNICALADITLSNFDDYLTFLK